MSDRIEVFRQMLESDPDNPMVMFGLANEYLKSDSYDEAIEILEKYLTYQTDEGAAYGMLARAYQAIGNPAKAISAYDRGIDVSLKNGHPSMAEEYRAAIDDQAD